MTMVTLGRGGAAQREVPLSAIRVPDIRLLAVGHPRKIHRRDMLGYYRALTTLLFAARVGSEYPPAFRVPDLWHAANTFAGEARDQVIEAWRLGPAVATALGYEWDADVTTSDSVFRRPRRAT